MNGRDGTPASSQSSTSPYKPNTSFLLIGIRGSGKSSLAFLAATAYNRRLVDIERAFFERTGQSLAEHRKTVNIDEYHKHHQEVLKTVLEEHKEGCVIVCNFSDLEHGGITILQDFARTHPVIHITRDVKGIQLHTRVWSEEKTAHLLTVSGPLLRACSNFEFFNKTENGANILPLTSDQVDGDEEFASGEKSPAPSLTLKRVERDFLKFLRQILGDFSRKPSHQSAYPLSQIPAEQRRYTYATVVEATHILAGSIDLEDVQIGADALQIVFDMSAGGEIFDPHAMGEIFATVRRATILPIILDILPNFGSPSRPQRDRYIQHIGSCIRLAPEYITIQPSWFETDFRKSITLSGGVSVIGRFSVQGWDNPETAILCDSEAFSIIQIVSEAQDLSDNLVLENFKAKLRITEVPRKAQISAFNYGRVGRPSQYLNKVLAPVLPVGVSLHSTHLGMPGITAKQGTKALFASFLLDPLHFCIFGANVSYSLSPVMHNAAYKACGMPHKYSAHSTTSLETIIASLRQDLCGGAAITQPHKIDIVSRLDSLSRHAKFIRAANTVIPLRQAFTADAPSDLDIVNSRNRAGPVLSLHGENTDWIGIRACIRRGLSPINTIRPSSCGLVIGAGGMSRAAIYAMIHLGVQNVFVYNRTTVTAQALADYYNGLEDLRSSDAVQPQDNATDNAKYQYTIHVISSIDDAWPAGYSLPTMIVCSVPAQTPDGETATNFTLPPAWIQSRSGGVVVELAYRPLVTPLVRQVRAESHRGWIIMHGLDMLPEQAFAQFELFTGRRAPRRLMRQQVLARFREEQQRADALTVG